MDKEDQDFIADQFEDPQKGQEQPFPLYQWSKFAGTDEQFVVRSNDQTIFEKAIGYVKTNFASNFLVGPKTPTGKQPYVSPTDTGEQTSPTSDSDVCPVHQVKFIWSKYPSQFTGQKYRYHYNSPGIAEKTCYEDKVRKQLKNA